MQNEMVILQRIRGCRNLNLQRIFELSVGMPDLLFRRRPLRDSSRTPGLDNNDSNLPPSSRHLEEDLATNLGIRQLDILSKWL